MAIPTRMELQRVHMSGGSQGEQPPVTYYTLTVSPADATMGTVSGGGSYASGTQVQIKATAKSGYRFVKWSDNDTHATRTVTVNADATYTAVFEVEPNPDWLYGVFDVEEGDSIVDDPNLESGLTPAYFEDGHSSDFRMTTGTSFIVLYNPNEVVPESWVVDKGSQFEESGNNFNQGVDWITGTYQHSNGETYNWFQYNGVSQGTNSMLCEITFAKAVNL